MQIPSIVKDIKFTVVNTGATAETTAVDTSYVDMSGFDSVAFLTYVDDTTTNSVITSTIKMNTVTSSTTAASTTGASATYTAASTTTDDDKVVVADCIKPTQRYVYAALTRTAATTTFGPTIALQYNAHAVPVTQPTTVGASGIAVSA